MLRISKLFISNPLNLIFFGLAVFVLTSSIYSTTCDETSNIEVVDKKYVFEVEEPSSDTTIKFEKDFKKRFFDKAYNFITFLSYQRFSGAFKKFITIPLNKFLKSFFKTCDESLYSFSWKTVIALFAITLEYMNMNDMFDKNKRDSAKDFEVQFKKIFRRSLFLNSFLVFFASLFPTFLDYSTSVDNVFTRYYLNYIFMFLSLFYIIFTFSFEYRKKSFVFKKNEVLPNIAVFSLTFLFYLALFPYISAFVSIILKFISSLIIISILTISTSYFIHICLNFAN